MGDFTSYQANQTLIELNPYERAIQEYFAAPQKEKKTSCEKLISVLGSHPKLIDTGKKMIASNDPRMKEKYLSSLNSVLPAQSDRDAVVREYLRQHKTRNRIQRQVTLQRAEEIGEIKDIMKREYLEQLQYKVSLLLLVAMNGLVDVNADAGGGDDYDQEFDGVTFRG
jgi:hypothetical protein